MKSRKTGILAGICTLIFKASMAHSLSFLQALQCCSFAHLFHTFLPVADVQSDILWSLERGQGAQSDSFHERKKMPLKPCAAKPCAHCMQEGGASRWSALPWGSWDQSGSCQRWTKAQACFEYSCISDSAFLIFAHTLKSTRFFASLIGSMNPRVSLSPPPPGVVLLSVVLPSLSPKCSNPLSPTAPAFLLSWLLRSLYLNIYKIEREKKNFFTYYLFLLVGGKFSHFLKPAHSHQGNTGYHTSCSPSQDQICLTE